MKEEKCPYCGSKNFVNARQSGYTNIRADKTWTFKEQVLYHIICLDCGTVVRSYVKFPEQFVIKGK